MIFLCCIEKIDDVNCYIMLYSLQVEYCYILFPTGRKLTDSQGDPTTGTLTATANEVRPLKKINRCALFASIAD